MALSHPLPPRPRVFLTGGASGLGRAFALKLAQRQARLLVTDINLAGAEETAAEVTRLGGEAFALALDVRDRTAFAAMADAMDERFGGTDLIINNAGVAVAGPVGDVSLADWDFAMEINLYGVIYGCHTFIPRMKAAGSGAVLNVASAAGFACMPEMGPYNVSKAGVIALSETLFAELSPLKMGVTVLCPTFFPTNIMESFRSSSERQRRLAEALFRRSTTTAEAVAEAALNGLEQGELVVTPQRDAQAVRRLKGLAPGVFVRLMAGGAFKKVASRLLGR